jgi:RNA polymerase sigma factor (sigma-70 family)
MVEATFEQAYPIAVRAAKVRSTAAVASGAIRVADREDIEQEGLTACWRALPKFDPGRASLRTFIERVVASHITSLLRSARRSPAFLPLSDAQPPLIQSEARAQEFQADFERLSAAFGCPDRQLVLLLLEHSPAEVGRMMGIPPTTIHGRLVRLRRTFTEAGMALNGRPQ